MRTIKKHPDNSNGNLQPKNKSGRIYIPLPSTNLPEGYTVENGFLKKDGTVISLPTSSLIEMAVQGFLHVDMDESYNPGNTIK